MEVIVVAYGGDDQYSGTAYSTADNRTQIGV